MNAADTGFVLVSAMLVMLMVPALALFYGGLVASRNVLSTTMHSFVLLGVGALLWPLVGYTLAFGPDMHGLIGGFEHLFLRGVGMEPAEGSSIPALAFMAFQCMFAALTPALISGAYAERIHFQAMLLFSTASFAQIDFGIIRYQPEVDFGFSAGAGNWKSDRINIQTVHGVQIDEYLFAGVGTGIDYHYDAEMTFMPLFLNFKGFLPVWEKVSPFVSLDMGYGVCLSENGESGFTISPAIGVKLFNHFKFQFGYNSQKMSSKGVSINMGAVQFKVGYFF